MSATKKKEEIITFKVDEVLAKRLSAIPNRSEFIRKTLLNALDSVCPLCQGKGVLTLDQQHHWQDFLQDHKVEECDDCHAFRITCQHH